MPESKKVCFPEEASGLWVDGDGLYPVQEKIDAIKHKKMWASLGRFWVWYSIIQAFYQ